ncbi:MAG: DUF4440 domain-containing protein [Pyrinomonadaceae bacterium]
MKFLLIGALMTAAFAALVTAQTSSTTIGKTGHEKIRLDLDDVHKRVRDAVGRHDKAALERLYADEFLFIHTTGDIDTKAEWVAKSLTVGTPNTPPTPDPIYIDIYRDVAVRTGRANLSDGRAIWWTWVYVKRDGCWHLARQHGSAVAAPSVEVKVDPKVLDAYVGTYEYVGGASFTVVRRGDTLVAHNPARPEVTLISESESQFHVPGGGAVYTFHKDEKDQVTHIIVRRANGQEFRANKVK